MSWDGGLSDSFWGYRFLRVSDSVALVIATEIGLVFMLRSLVEPSARRFGAAINLFRPDVVNTATATTTGKFLRNHPVIDQARNALDHIARVVYAKAPPAALIDSNRDKAAHHIERLHLDALKIWHLRRLEMHWQDHDKHPVVADHFRQYIHYEQAYCTAKRSDALEDSHKHRVSCYSKFGGIPATDGPAWPLNEALLDSKEIEELILYYWNHLKPLIADYEVKTGRYSMDAACQFMCFWGVFYDCSTTADVLANFGDCTWKMLLILIHYECRIRLSYQRFRPDEFKLNDSGVGADDWEFARQLYQISGGDQLKEYADDIPTIDFSQVKRCVSQRIGGRAGCVGVQEIIGELQALYNTIGTVRHT